jgi:multidrug efflux system membrane fusion protein
MKRWYSLLLMVSVALLLTACSGDDTPARPVRAVTVQLSNIAAEYSYPGVVRARYDNPLAFQVGGKIASRLVEIGDTVHPKQLLATLDTRDLKLNLQNKQGQLQAAESDLNLTKTERDRYEPLFKKQIISASQYQQVQAKYESALARLQQAQSDLSAAQQQLAYADLYADYDGVITQVQASPGQVVSAGQAVFQLARSNQKEILINVPEQRIAQWHGKITKIIVRLWAYPQKQYSAQIREIADDADAVTRTYAVKLTVTNADNLMQLGMTANVLAAEQRMQPAITLPLTAVFDRENKPYVWVIDPKTMKVQAVTVTLGNYAADSIIVTTGLQAGQKVVTAGVHALRAGQKVTLLGE